MEIISEQNITNLKDTKVFAHRLSNLFSESDIVVFNGNLGSGKTTIIKYICLNYGIDNVKSPSFSIVNEYFGAKKIYHFDFYRLKKIEELYDIGFEDYINDCDAIVFIEWGNLMPEIIPKSHFEILLDITSDNERKVKIIKQSISS